MRLNPRFFDSRKCFLCGGSPGENPVRCPTCNRPDQVFCGRCFSTHSFLHTFVAGFTAKVAKKIADALVPEKPATASIVLRGSDGFEKGPIAVPTPLPPRYNVPVADLKAVFGIPEMEYTPGDDAPKAKLPQIKARTFRRTSETTPDGSVVYEEIQA